MRLAVTKTLTIKVNGKKSTLSKKVFIYLGDGGTTLLFDIVDNNNNNMAVEFESTHAEVCILTASNKVIYDRDCEIINGMIEFELTSEFVNEIAEEGSHLLQVHLYDEANNRRTIPPITLTLLKPICDIANDPSTP